MGLCDKSNDINKQNIETDEKSNCRRKKLSRKKRIAVIIIVVCAFFALIRVLNNVVIHNVKYNDALALMESGHYTEAIEAFEALNGYKNSAEKILDCKYNDAIALMKSGQYTEAITAFEALDGYKDSVEQIEACKTAILDGKYNDAIALMDDEKYVEAYEAFIALEGYKDSADKASSIYGKYKPEKLKVAEVGDYVFFGTYEQDNNTVNGKEDIEWLVLDKQEDRILVISKYALECKPYYIKYTDVTWETCTLRQWLNNDFISSSFSDDEKAVISEVNNINPGNATQDKVFLLSIAEVNKYFSSDSKRKCEGTEYTFARANESYVDNIFCWWLRSPGRYWDDKAAWVGFGGEVYEDGISVGYDRIGVRPALWIDLNS